MTKLKYCYSHLKSFVFMFWVVLFMFLIIWTSHTLQIHFFHPTSFFSSQIHSLNSFKSYIVSCITNLDNSVHPFHFPCSSFHTHYQSAFRMLCYTIYPSFSTKKCTLPHILSQLKLCSRFELLIHVPSYTLKNNILDWAILPSFLQSILVFIITLVTFWL